MRRPRQVQNAIPVDSDVDDAERVVSGRRAGTPLRTMWTETVARRRVLAAISLGGSLGSAARWGVDIVVAPGPGQFAWATFLVNVSGGFALGVLMVLLGAGVLSSPLARPLLSVGFLGGFTTFSTYMLDARTQLASGHHVAAALYVFGTVAVGLLGVWAGMTLARAGIARRGEGAVL